MIYFVQGSIAYHLCLRGQDLLGYMGENRITMATYEILFLNSMRSRRCLEEYLLDFYMSL